MDSAYLDEVLAFRLSDERLELWCREGVDEPSFRDDEQEDLGASEDTKLIGLSLCQRMVGTRRVVVTRTFFMIPALRLEKVM